jgi:surface antigen
VNSGGTFHPYRNGYEYRNCTDYTQWQESQSPISVAVPTNWGNGGQWYGNAPTSEQSTTPKAWDAAVVPGNPGHVAFVQSVNSVDPNNAGNDNITVTEYNHDAQGHGDTRTGTASSMGFTEYVDFGVHPSSTSGIQMMLDGSGNVWAKSTSNQGTSGWNEEVIGGVAQVVADDADSIQMIRDTSGNVWAKSSTDFSSSGWTKEVTGGVAYIAAGGGLQFIITSGYLYSKVTSSISSSGWNIEINGGVSAVAE